MKRGFTLLELIVVIIIIGILGTLGFTQYTRVVEKGRTAEAKMILGSLRSAEVAYNLEKSGYGVLSTTTNDLAVEAPTSCSQTTHYFSYDCTNAGLCTATRCTDTNGKQPGGASAYTVTLSAAGAWDGTPGYY